MTCQNLIEYYIVDRLRHKTYVPYVCMNKYLIAHSNIATETKPLIINYRLLIVGLKDRRYRLVKRNF